MLTNLPSATHQKSIYPIDDILLPFSEYIYRCRSIIKANRSDLNSDGKNSLVIEANCPYQLYPSQPIYAEIPAPDLSIQVQACAGTTAGTNKIKYGVLLIHGLFDCPFSLKDIGIYLQKNGIFSRAVLLPGHGTKPSDLIDVTYHDWIQTVYYGIESLSKEVEDIILIGYSTGAALSIYHALKDPRVKKIILLSPAIRIKRPIDFLVSWHHLTHLLSGDPEWLLNQEENDYTKYRSIAYNPVKQVCQLTEVINELTQEQNVSQPMLMIMSREDETISSHQAMDFFTSMHNDTNHLLLYTSVEHRYPDNRIATRFSDYPDLRIKHFSHVAIPFSPENKHYGQHGDYPLAARLDETDYIYGAYNRVEVQGLNALQQAHLLKYKRRELTYNPDFDFMAQKILDFIR